MIGTITLTPKRNDMPSRRMRSRKKDVLPLRLGHSQMKSPETKNISAMKKCIVDEEERSSGARALVVHHRKRPPRLQIADKLAWRRRIGEISQRGMERDDQKNDERSQVVNRNAAGRFGGHRNGHVRVAFSMDALAQAPDHG